MTRKQRRLTLIASALLVLACAVGAILYGLSGSVALFSSPTDLVEKKIAPGTRIRLGGLVAAGSVTRDKQMNIAFEVTDGNKAVKVAYRGILPDLFREGQGVVTEGILEPGPLLRADNVLARHDENYMPKEVADSLKAQGLWKDGAPAPNPNTGRKP